jgi:hypothetical protein
MVADSQDLKLNRRWLLCPNRRLGGATGTCLGQKVAVPALATSRRGHYPVWVTTGCADNMAASRRRADEDTVALVRRLAVHCPDDVIAGILNRQQRTSAYGHRFTANIVSSLRRSCNIARYEPAGVPMFTPLPGPFDLNVPHSANVKPCGLANRSAVTRGTRWSSIPLGLSAGPSSILSARTPRSFSYWSAGT